MPCVVADSLVSIPERSVMRAGEVAQGRLLMCPVRGAAVVRKVVTGLANRFVRVNGRTLVTRPHPLFLADGRLVRADELRLGLWLASIHGPVEVRKLETFSAEPTMIVDIVTDGGWVVDNLLTTAKSTSHFTTSTAVVLPITWPMPPPDAGGRAAAGTSP